MPSADTVTPAQLAWSGAELTEIPAVDFITPATLRWTGAFVTSGPGTGTAVSVTTPKLDRIMRQEKIVGSDDTASTRFQTIWQRSMEAIEQAFAVLTQQVQNNTNVLAQIQAAQALAQVANDNAVEVQEQVSIANSYIDPTSAVTASNDGSITIAAHTRRYGDGSSVAVNGGGVSGFASGDYVQVYYDDAGREGGAVNYQGTTAEIAQLGARHIVGGVAIPQPGEPPVGGQTQPPPGYVPPRTLPG